MRKSAFCICKTKAQISVLVFTTQIVQSLRFLNRKFQASDHLLRLYSPVCVGLGLKPDDKFSHDATLMICFLLGRLPLLPEFMWHLTCVSRNLCV